MDRREQLAGDFYDLAMGRGLGYEEARRCFGEMHPDATAWEAFQAAEDAIKAIDRNIEKSEEVTRVLGPWWSKNPEATMTEAIAAVAAQGEPLAMKWHAALMRKAN